MCQLRAAPAFFCRPVSSLCCLKSTAAGKPLITPQTVGTQGNHLSKNIASKAGGTKGLRSITAKQQ